MEIPDRRCYNAEEGREGNGIQGWRCCSIYQSSSEDVSKMEKALHQESQGDHISSTSSITVIPIPIPCTVTRRKKTHYTTHALSITKRAKQTTTQKKLSGGKKKKKKKENRFRSAIPAPLGRRSQSFSLLFLLSPRWDLGSTYGGYVANRMVTRPCRKITRLPVLTERRGRGRRVS